MSEKTLMKEKITKGCPTAERKLEAPKMIETTALIIEVFCLVSLSIVFAKYTLLRRKCMNAKN
jgi:hypothetical protein